MHWKPSVEKVKINRPTCDIISYQNHIFYPFILLFGWCTFSFWSRIPSLFCWWSFMYKLLLKLIEACLATEMLPWLCTIHARLQKQNPSQFLTKLSTDFVQKWCMFQIWTSPWTRNADGNTCEIARHGFTVNHETKKWKKMW